MSIKVFSILILFWLSAATRAQTPAFKDYPARLVTTKTSVKVKIYSTADTSCFRTMLRQTARTGQRFAGHYALDYWGCGTNCARVGIVDLITGRAYVTPFYVGIAGGGGRQAIKTAPGSRLVLVNDPEVVRKEYGDPPPDEFAPAYFVWTGKSLLPIQNGKIEHQEPRRAFDRCGSSRTSSPGKSSPQTIGGPS